MPNIEGINIQQSSAERKSYVVVGAILSCSSGSKQSRLKMPFSHCVFVKGKPQMNIMDFVPNVNIMPFGKCSSLKNPTVASATAANNGVLTPMPCTPLTTMPWIDGKADKIVGGHPALLNKSTNMCFYCGLIKIEDDGQDLGGVTIGNQSSANSGPSASGFGQGPACEKPQEKPSMLDDLIKGISMLGDVPAAMQKAASELPGALEKAANDLPKGVGAFVREGYIEPMQEDLDTLRDGKVELADGIAIGGLALGVLTLGGSKRIKNLLDAARKGKKGTRYSRRPSDLFINDFALNGQRIAPKHLYRELRKSEVGKETLDYIQNNNVRVLLDYSKKPGVYGIAYGPDKAVIYVSNTQSVQKTAQKIIHETTHNKINSTVYTQREEVVAHMREAKHLNNELSFGDIRNIIKKVKRLYSELPYR
ncbi:hypothetical protein YSY22_10400 [Brevibacillus formosus]